MNASPRRVGLLLTAILVNLCLGILGVVPFALLWPFVMSLVGLDEWDGAFWLGFAIVVSVLYACLVIAVNILISEIFRADGSQRLRRVSILSLSIAWILSLTVLFTPAYDFLYRLVY